MRTRLFINVAVAVGLIFTLQANASSDCNTRMMTREQSLQRIQEITAQNPSANFLSELLTTYDRVSSSHAELAELIPQAEVHHLAADSAMLSYPQTLLTILLAVEKDKSKQSFSEKFTAAVTATLQNQVPADTIAPRIKDFLAHKPNSLVRVLGDMERSEVHELLYGKDLAHPSSESLLGQYIKETGAATLMRTFDISMENKSQGPKRLVVSISKESFPAFIKYFSRPEFTSVFGHAYMVQSGKINSYAHRYQDYREQGAGNILPWVTLKTTEGQRLDRYFRAMSLIPNNGWNHPLMTPWDAGYCDASAWITCTQWIGNIPIGDTMVDTWTLPGPIVDGKPVINTANGDKNSNPPLVTTLKSHTMAEQQLKEIFTVPGHMQFSEVIGQLHTNAAGEFANPGWVVQTLIGPTAEEFVPVVFLWADDHKAPIAKDFVPQFERPN